MSWNKDKQMTHCNFCGKFSKNDLGEYTRKDGSAGYINNSKIQEVLPDSLLDCCDECDPTPEQIKAKDKRLKAKMQKEKDKS